MFTLNSLYKLSIVKVISLVGLILVGGSSLVSAEIRVEERLPILFDTKERLPGADLSSFSRIRFLLSVDFPPFNFTDQEGRLSGVHVDLIRDICRELKVESKCQIQALPFDELEGALELGEGEVVVSGIAPSGALRRNYAFSRPFFRMPARFAVNKKSGLKGEASKALDGKAVGVLKGSRYEAMLKAFFPKSTPVAFAKRQEMQEALIDSKVDAIFADGLRLPFWVNGSDSKDCCELFDSAYFSDQHLGEGFMIMAIDQNNQLIPAFDQALAELSRNGRLDEIYRRYFPFGFY